MTQWEVVLVIGTLLTIVLGITGPVVRLNTNIARLNVVLDGLKEDVGELKAAHARDIGELRREGADRQRRICERVDKLDERVDGQERALLGQDARIQVLERRERE